MSSELQDYSIIKEGAAEILMHKKNEVFYNKTQVNNRDMSVAVLKCYISKRKQEHTEALIKKSKTPTKKLEDTPDECKSNKSSDFGECCGVTNCDANFNGNCKVEDGSMDYDSHCINEEPLNSSIGKKELKKPRVLEALSASGLRALRYALEVEEIGEVVALDNNKACLKLCGLLLGDRLCFMRLNLCRGTTHWSCVLFLLTSLQYSNGVSVEACKRNIKFNGSVALAKIESHNADARIYMLTHPKEFDVVDLDPYGSPSEFLDSAVQSVSDGGMLMCTATDMAVLCGANGEVCYAKYGSYSLRVKYCHEMALRILLASIESHANRYKRYIVPVLSVQMDFYIRVFVRIYTSASALKNTPLKLSYVYQCTGCDSFHMQPVGRTVCKGNNVRHMPSFGPAVPQECSDCGKKFHMGGPIWSAPIHDVDWVTSILSEIHSSKECYPAYQRISAVLTNVSEELPDVPLFLSIHNICSTLKCTSPSAIIFQSAVVNANYRISGTHVNPLGMKTDAPMDVIWDIMRCWVKAHPVKAQPADQAGSVILSKSPSIEANFSRAVSLSKKTQAKKAPRFLPNPEPNWGPKLRAGRRVTEKHVSLLGRDAVTQQLQEDEAEDEEEEEAPGAKRSKLTYLNPPPSHQQQPSFE